MSASTRFRDFQNEVEVKVNNIDEFRKTRTCFLICQDYNFSVDISCQFQKMLTIIISILNPPDNPIEFKSTVTLHYSGQSLLKTCDLTFDPEKTSNPINFDLNQFVNQELTLNVQLQKIENQNTNWVFQNLIFDVLRNIKSCFNFGQQNDTEDSMLISIGKDFLSSNEKDKNELSKQSSQQVSELSPLTQPVRSTKVSEEPLLFNSFNSSQPAQDDPKQKASSNLFNQNSPQDSTINSQFDSTMKSPNLFTPTSNENSPLNSRMNSSDTLIPNSPFNSTIDSPMDPIFHSSDPFNQNTFSQLDSRMPSQNLFNEDSQMDFIMNSSNPFADKSNGNSSLESQNLPETPHSNSFSDSWDLNDIEQILGHPTEVGIRNQGSTCYLNSIMQAFYHLPIFRKFIFSINSLLDPAIEDSKNVILNIQILFAQLQTSKTAISTENLTRSFGWTAEQVYHQQDAAEFFCQLLDNINDKLKNTTLKNEINNLFQIVTRTTYSGIDTDFEEHSDDSFYILQLVVSNLSAITDSLDQLTRKQMLTDDNQYDSDKYGKQDAYAITQFVKAPPILFIHLKRFEFDPFTNQNVKINSIFMFSEELDLRPYFSQTEEIPNCNYELYGVLVHIGNANSGHYIVYIKNKDDVWICYNDSNVTVVNKEQAIDNNFGGPDPQSESSEERNFSAYILLYIKQDEKENVFCDVDMSSVDPKILEKQRKINDDDDSIRVFISNEDTLKRIAFEGQISFYLSREYLAPIFSWRSFSPQNFYNSVNVQLSLDSNEFYLYKFTDNYLTEKIPKSETGTISGFFNDNSFLFCSTPHDPLSSHENDITIIIFIYNPTLHHPLRYLLQFNTRPTEFILPTISDVIKNQFDLISFHPVVSYKLGSVIKQVNEDDHLTFEMVKSSIFILECEADSYAMSTLTLNSVNNRDDNEPYSVQLVHFFDYYNEHPQAFSSYFELMHDMKTITIRSIDDLDKAITVRVPNSISFDAFSMFLKAALKIDSSQDLQIFKSTCITPIDSVFNNAPVFKAIRDADELIVVHSSDQNDSIAMLDIEISIDAVHIFKRRFLFVEVAMTVDTVLDILKNEELELRQFPQLRVLKISNGMISSIYSLHQQIITLQNPIRIEPCTYDPSENMIPVIFQSFDSNEKLNFLIPIIKDEPFEFTKQRILLLLKMGDANIDKMLFSLKSPNDNSLLADNSILSDLDKTSSMIKVSQLPVKSQQDTSLKIMN